MRKILLFCFLLPVIIMSCNRSTRSFFHEGVSAELAAYRSRQIYDVNYQLHFSIPDNKDEAVKGTATIHFKPLKARHGLILDFTPGQDAVHSLRVNGDTTEYFIMNGHIYIDANLLIPRQVNKVEISFTASDQALNRSDEFMYTLFVPDRASTAFPCFDQPDIKATFALSMDIPESWTALSNGSEISTVLTEGRKTITFSPDKPISTYLFAFTAGEFEVVSNTQDGRTIRLFHRETDQQKLENNVQAVFDQHFSSLRWLEEYTGIEYPYGKFDMALLPGFQYSGMEHPGAVWYRDTRLLLDPDAPLSQIMRKASLIAHETSHMWFGDLVTMKWFDDVWLKEVYAGFMADKIVKEQFTQENHRLLFILSHYPRAMSVDRTPGTHPIRQRLANMKNAGTLYGPVIYNKAPIVFEQLEYIMQPAAFRQATQQYLGKYSHGNATWDDLVKIFDSHSPRDIGSWSNAWVYGKGMPVIRWSYNPNNSNNIEVTLDENTYHEDFPSQFLAISVIGNNKSDSMMVWLEKSPLSIDQSSVSGESAVLLNGKGMGYGYFELHDSDIGYIMDNYIKDDVSRAVAYMNIYENFLNRNVGSNIFYKHLIKSLTNETDPLIQGFLLDNLKVWVFNFPEYGANPALHKEVENLLWEKMVSSPPRIARTFFDSWVRLSRTKESTELMRELYLGNVNAGELTLSDENLTELALEASIRSALNRDLLQKELQRITNPDRLKRLQFILPAASVDKKERDSFFSWLANADNRNPEPWVLEALYYLHHPMHPGQGIDYVPQSLAMLKEIQRTGDIFFPQNWLMATIDNYSSPQVAKMVDEYLENNPDLGESLRLKVLQAGHILKVSTQANNE